MKTPLALAVAALLAACGGGNPDQSAGDSHSMQLAQSAVMRQTASTPSATALNDFIASAWRDGESEIRLAQLAVQRATSNEVQGFAQRMITDHTLVDQRLQQLAQQLGVTLPADAAASADATFAQLSSLSGNEFDRAYMADNVTTHDRDVAAFRTQALQIQEALVAQQGQQGTAQTSQPSSQALTAAAALVDAVLPLLQLHLTAAGEIQNLLDPNAFLANAYQDGLAEIALAQLAQQNATSTDVRSFAQRMIDDHTRVNNQLRALAEAKAATLPTAPSAAQQAARDDLARFTGTDFDRAYMDMNVVAHAKDIFAARRQSQNGTDTAVRAAALAALPTFIEHFFQALTTDRSLTPSFLYSAAQDGKAEIAFSTLALVKSQNASVQSFAQRMITDHGAANLQAAQLAQQAGKALPTELSPQQQAVYIELYAASASSFDGRYMSYNVQAHRQDVLDATTQSQQSADAPSRTLATALLPVLQQHLALAEQVQMTVQQASSQSGSATGTSNGNTGTGASGTTAPSGAGSASVMPAPVTSMP